MLCTWYSAEDQAKRGPQRKGGPGATPINLKKKLDGKWCNQSYSGALFVNKK